MNESEPLLYNLKELQSLAADDDVFFREMITLFIEQNESAIVEIKNEMNRGNQARVTGILHKMKPSVIVMGVTEVSELIKKAEALEVKPEHDVPFRNLVAMIETLLIRVNAQLKEL